MGGAQPLAATMNGAAFLGIDVDPERIKRRVKTGYCDVMVTHLDEALRILKNAVRKGEATFGWASRQLCRSDSRDGAGVASCPTCDRSDQRARSDLRVCTERNDVRRGSGVASTGSGQLQETSMAAMARHVQGMLDFRSWGGDVRLRKQHSDVRVLTGSEERL